MSEYIFDEDLSGEALGRLLENFSSPGKVSEVFFALREAIDIADIRRGELYPEVLGGALQLRRALARAYGVEPIQAQPNFGCNGCIDTLLTYVRGLELLSHDRSGFMAATPTYFRYYHKVEALGMKFFGVPFDPDYRYPVGRILEEVQRHRPSCLFMVSPNNPTGVPITDEDLVTLLDSIPEDVYVVLDRTCANADPEVPTAALLSRYAGRRILVFHSLSKYYGMSHLRMGFALVADKETAIKLNQHLPFGLNLEALLRATHLLVSGGALRPDAAVLRNITQSRALMREFLARRPDYSCTDFRGNYALLFPPAPLSAASLARYLLERRILVMPGGDLPEPDDRYVRIHVGGAPALLERLIDAVEKW